MLHDRARIHVKAGGGGDGCQSFRREAHVPKGGPDGGDGGRGGDVVLVCDDSLRDLQSFRRAAHFKAHRGGHGQGALRHGANGEQLVIRVPPGTVARTEDGTRHDLTIAGQRAIVGRGGPGGRGNKRFATPTRQAPRFAERGLPGEEGWVELRLKLLADAGLVGLPNAGKSSLLARLTRARPKVAGYPFTTLAPVLGTIEAGERQLVVADIPGLIAGASQGAGLGHDFLAHVERTRLLVHVLDLAPPDGSDPVANHATIERELAAHDAQLAGLPRLLALSKADLTSAAAADATARVWRERLGPDVPVLVTSSATGQGLQELRRELVRRVPLAAAEWSEPKGEEAPPPLGVGAAADGPEARAGANPGGGAAEAGAELAEHRVFRPAAGRGFTVERSGDGRFAVTGSGIERLVARYDLDNEEALAYLEGRLRSIGVIRELQERGFQPGDDVEIAGVVFELDA